MDTAGKHVIYYATKLDGFLVSLRPPDRSSPGSNSCICHLLVYAHAVNVGVTQPRAPIIARRQTILKVWQHFCRQPIVHLKLICTWPCLWFGVIAADKPRTDVFGVFFFLFFF